MTEMISCKCGARWTGPGRAHCAADDCHQTFGGVTSFDVHRKNGTCLDPAVLGLILNAKGIWVAQYGETGSDLPEQ